MDFNHGDICSAKGRLTKKSCRKARRFVWLYTLTNLVKNIHKGKLLFLKSLQHLHQHGCFLYSKIFFTPFHNGFTLDATMDQSIEVDCVRING